MFSSQEQKIASPILRKTLEVLDVDSSEETYELMDPVSLQLLIIPLKPSRKSRLQAVELGSLREHLRARRQRACFHPLDPSLRMTKNHLKNYVVDEAVLLKRDAYLYRNGYSLDEFLAYRGLSRQEYQQLLNMFHTDWVLPAIDFGMLGLISAAGIGAYLYRPGPQSLFFSCTEPHEGLSSSYRILRNIAGSVSIMNTALAHFAWNKSNKALETVGVSCAGFLATFLLLWGEVYVLTEYSESHETELSHNEDHLTVISLMMAKLCIPAVQGGLVAMGKSFLSRFSLFAREEELVNTYVNRKSLEQEQELEAEGLNLSVV